MLVLFWTGKIFCDFFNSSKVVAVYLLGGIAGALLYLSAYNIFPAFSNELPLSKLIGASAGVVAVLVAIATLVPDYSVHLLFFGPVRLKYIAIFLVLLYLISIPEGNAGGNIAHIGGALFGFTYTRLLRKGTDTGRWMEKLLNAATGILKPSPKIKVVHKRGQAHSGNSPSQQEVIDAILDKITRSGYSSLTAKEKEILFNASKNKDH